MDVLMAPMEQVEEGLTQMPPSTVLAVNKPCACLHHLLSVHFVEPWREKTIWGQMAGNTLVVYLGTKYAYTAKLLHFL